MLYSQNYPRAHGLSLRADIVTRLIQMGNKDFWVVKDPISLSFYYFTEREYSILKMLKGCRTLQDIVEEYSRKFAPEYLSGDSLIAFLAGARKNGLINTSSVIPTKNNEQSIDHHRGSRRLISSNLLAIRIPGINPTAFLNVIYPWTRSLFSKGFLFGCLFVFLFAFTLFVIQFDRFVNQLPGIQAWATPPVLLTVLITIAITKVFHELAHALSCKHFGGECREMGVMFLVFIPCLYCDVSDAWLFPSRRHRIMVSAAGMLVEVMFASFATLLWFYSIDGPVRMICLSVMSVCAINTLLANGNPLMRYDGYFILSDVLGIPNLGGESAGLFQRTVKRWIWGLPKPVIARGSRFSPIVLTIYAILSGLYRYFILGVILWGIHQVMKNYQLSPVAWAFSFMVLGGLIVHSAKQYLLPSQSDRVHKNSNALRRVFAALIFVGVIFLFLSVPLPRSISTSLIVEPSKAREVFVIAPGLLVKSIPPGTSVKKDEVIGQLENISLQKKHAAAKNEEQILLLQLEQIKALRGADPQLASKIPSVSAALSASTDQRKLVEKEMRQLTLYAPQEGTVLSPPNRMKKPEDKQNHSSWSGTPLDRENSECYLERGTLYSLVGDPNKIAIVLIISQREISLVHKNDRMQIYLPGFENGTLSGKVIEIDPSPITEIPRELIAKKQIPTSSLAKSHGKPREPHYRVRVQLPSSAPEIPIRTTGFAKIRVTSASLFHRLQRLLKDSFRFEL